MNKFDPESDDNEIFSIVFFRFDSVGGLIPGGGRGWVVFGRNGWMVLGPGKSAPRGLLSESMVGVSLRCNFKVVFRCPDFIR